MTWNNPTPPNSSYACLGQSWRSSKDINFIILSACCCGTSVRLKNQEYRQYQKDKPNQMVDAEGFGLEYQ